MIGDDLRHRRLMPLAVRVRAGEDRHATGGLYLHLARLPESRLGAQRADHLRGCDAAGLDIRREADADELALGPPRRLVGPELLVVEHREHLVERRPVVAAVVRERDLGLVAVVELRDEVPPPQLDRVHLAGGRRHIDHPLDGVAGFRPTCASIGVHRRRVGEHAGDLAVNRPHLVDAVQERAVQVRRHRRRERGEIGAEIGGGPHPEAEDLAVLGQGHLGVGDVVAPVRVGLEGLGPLRRPPDRALDLARGPGAHRLLVVEEDLGAEGRRRRRER